MKIKIPWLTELRGSVCKEIWKAGTTAKTYERGWISIGKRAIPQKPLTRLQKYVKEQVHSLAYKWRDLDQTEKEYYIQEAIKTNSTPWARYWKENFPHGKFELIFRKDVYADQTRPNQNTGSEKRIRLKKQWGERKIPLLGYSDFLFPIPAQVEKVYLNLYCTDIIGTITQTNYVTIQPYKGTINEGTVTWNNLPSLVGMYQDVELPTNDNEWWRVDITFALGEGLMGASVEGFVLLYSSDMQNDVEWVFASREDHELKKYPYLEIILS